MVMEYVAKPPLPRNQLQLFPEKLDDIVAGDHPVRLLDELLDLCDFAAFEERYDGGRGQPPFPPRTLAKLWLYALSRGIRSSRRVADALIHQVDFMWLANGYIIGPVTLSNFRKDFGEDLKVLFRQLGRIAREAGIIHLNRATFDGTRVKAHNSRRNTLTAAGLERHIAELDQQIGEFLRASEQADQADDDRVGTVEADREVADLKQRREVLLKARDQAARMDAERRARLGPQAAAQHPAQIPMNDPDSRVLPNKEGGMAPNYTPLTAVDVGSDLILSEDVLGEANEHPALLDALRRIKADLGVSVPCVLTDGLNGTGQNIAALEDSETQLFSPVGEPAATGPNPAERADPTQPVPEAERPNLPLNGQGKLDRSCFLYDADQDLYHCPQGQPLTYEETKPREISGEVLQARIYRCHACAGCPLAALCLAARNKHGRTISRDEYTPQRERHATKMATPEAKATYKSRLHAGETPFAHIKRVLGLRQFLLKGLERVKTEWCWACTAYNVTKLLQSMDRIRNRSVPAAAPRT
jgi:transposase